MKAGCPARRSAAGVRRQHEAVPRERCRLTLGKLGVRASARAVLRAFEPRRGVSGGAIHVMRHTVVSGGGRGPGMPTWRNLLSNESHGMTGAETASGGKMLRAGPLAILAIA